MPRKVGTWFLDVLEWSLCLPNLSLKRFLYSLLECTIHIKIVCATKCVYSRFTKIVFVVQMWLRLCRFFLSFCPEPFILERFDHALSEKIDFLIFCLPREVFVFAFTLCHSSNSRSKSSVAFAYLLQRKSLLQKYMFDDSHLHNFFSLELFCQYFHSSLSKLICKVFDFEGIFWYSVCKLDHDVQFERRKSIMV